MDETNPKKIIKERSEESRRESKIHSLAFVIVLSARLGQQQTSNIITIQISLS